jgi:hypothetical protein
MRVVLAPLLLAPLAALAAPDLLAPFEPAVDQIAELAAQDNSTLVEDGTLELLKRQGNTCATNYYPCVNLNAPSVCCPRTAVCSFDLNRNPACCPQGTTCTGTLGAPAGPAATTGTGTPTFVFASTTTAAATSQGPFVQQTTGPLPNAGARSTVQNAFYPFPFIATTYTNAAACSAAYTGCQTDAAMCTTALANGAQGVTISAPNGGATITAVPSIGLQSAQSICASLSSQACYGLQVEACRSFDGQGAAPTRACGGLMMGAGVAVGIAGQLLR